MIYSSAKLWFCGLVLVALPVMVLSEPYLPADDDEILETLPKDVFSRDSELAQLRKAQANDPENKDLATKLVDHYIQLGNQTGDPRYYGYAQAILRPWWKLENPGIKVLQQRAKLQEKQHDYESALSDLNTLLANDPGNAQAWINASNIYRVQGRYEQALQACEPLQQLRGRMISIFCTTPVHSLTGNAHKSYQTLGSILPRARGQSQAFYHWALTTMAEIAVALGMDEQAESHFREAYELDATDFYLLRGYADFLIDHDRPAEALKLLEEHTTDNGILLRAAIAAKQAGMIKLAMQYSRTLKSRFDEIRLRDGTPHGRYESRYELVFGKNVNRAVEIASANWQHQKEPRDTRNLLEAALAAGNVQAAMPAMEFLQKNNTEDVVLQGLVRQLTEKLAP